MERGPVSGTRWTVIRDAAPEYRRPASDSGRRRPRAVVRCWCGREQIAYVADLVPGPDGLPPRSTGCRTRRCGTLHRVALELRATSDWPLTMEAFDQRVAGMLRNIRIEQ